ncbi:hypothetical protein [Glycomyces artemisiae]|uniref:Uncharacterized protein n=1 Tax=Glycomyces artemisiae TaxID=1076443 RepID=A0A2T0UET8_9ACTN|nr:hypothetical protein [Glycomyces artemisiae]PRY56456.1 hypothetical protein B0I28_109105 [Glycomyces artemisiae]
MTDVLTSEQRARLELARELAASSYTRLNDAITAVNQLCDNKMEPRQPDDLVHAARWLRGRNGRLTISARIRTTLKIWRALR